MPIPTQDIYNTTSIPMTHRTSWKRGQKDCKSQKPRMVAGIVCTHASVDGGGGGQRVTEGLQAINSY